MWRSESRRERVLGSETARTRRTRFLWRGARRAGWARGGARGRCNGRCRRGRGRRLGGGRAGELVVDTVIGSHGHQGLAHPSGQQSVFWILLAAEEAAIVGDFGVLHLVGI